MATNVKSVYKRILLKLNGEALQGTEGFSINASILGRMAREIKKLIELGIQVDVVIGGDNLFRGAGLAKAGINRVVDDHMGMLAIVMSGLVIRDVLHRAYVNARLMSAIPLNGVCGSYNRAEAASLLRNNRVMILSAGTGNPFLTTDSAACLRGIGVEADAVLKAIEVDDMLAAGLTEGSTATMYEQLTYNEMLEKELKVMDLTAFTLACDHKLPIRIFNVNKSGVLRRVVVGGKEGTLVTEQFPWWVNKGKIPRKYRGGSYP